MRESKGNMYVFVTHTHNDIQGKCSHDCKYCYMKEFEQHPIRLNEKALRENLGSGNFIFFGSSTDMFANDVPSDWIIKTLEHCKKYPNNRYLFQTKNTIRLYEFKSYFNEMHVVLGTTIESNRVHKDFMGNTIHPAIRAQQLVDFKTTDKLKKMVTIEPIMDFDVEELTNLIKICEPEWINIGADSKNHNLPEPSPEKIRALIKNIAKFTDIKGKHNLRRIVVIPETEAHREEKKN